MNNSNLQNQVNNLPSDPGIYKFFNAENELLYVGKAVNLKSRVKSYFADKNIAPRTKALVSNIHHLEYIVVQSEIDALILEANLIKEHNPRFNVILKDDKSYLYIKITLYEDWPRISTSRATDIHLDPKATYFGPYPSGRIVKDTLRSLRKIFPYVAHNQPPVEGRRRPPQSYFYYNLALLNQCEEPDKKEYRRQIFQIVRFLEGKRQSVIEDLEKTMNKAAKQLKFEEAAELKKQLDNMAYVTQKTISPESYVSNPELMADKRDQGLKELATTLSPYWPSHFTEVVKPQQEEPKHSYNLQRIECFDISNISGQYAVGSMVVFENGEPLKSDYRKFRIKKTQAPNDVAMMTEVLRRRLKRLGQQNSQTNATDKKSDQSFATPPDLMIVDGGKGQLSAVHQILKQNNVSVPLVGMTKREEEIVLVRPSVNNKGEQASGDYVLHSRSARVRRSSAHGAIPWSAEDAKLQAKSEANFITIRLPRGSEALFIMQRIRDEAHRFAITYHRSLRSKGFLPGE